jgi:biotin synthase
MPKEKLWKLHKPPRKPVPIIFASCAATAPWKPTRKLLRFAEPLKKSKTVFKLVCCASLGIIPEKVAIAIKEAGIIRYNHNLNTEEEFYKEICTTHTYEDRLKTAQVVRDSGMELCCGVIWGMGETIEQRVKLAFALRDLAPEEVPINLLHPIPGTL